MIQLHLPRIEKEKINTELLSRETKGTIAVYINEHGKLVGMDQNGSDVAVTSQNAAPVTAPAGDPKALKAMEDSLSEAISKVGTDLEEKFAKDLEEASKAFTGQVEQLQKEIKTAKVKPAAKPKAAKKK